MRILYVHGWACGPNIWKRTSQRLQALINGIDLEPTFADLGFFTDPELPAGHFDLVIGHSLGVLWLLDCEHVTFDRIVSINGFTRFSASEDFQCGWPHRIVERMRKQLAKDANAVIADFMNNAAASGFPEIASDDSGDTGQSAEAANRQVDVERLNWALEALINVDCREQWSTFQGPRRVIAATDDKIVSVEHTNACFLNDDIQWLKSDCHVLPLKFPEICAALVRELIEVS